MSAFIPLARVMFREAVAVPGVTQDGKMFANPTHEEVLLSSELAMAPGVLRRDRFELMLDSRLGQVLIKHPKSGEVERVPLSMVRQMRLLSEVQAAKPVENGARADAR